MTSPQMTTSAALFWNSAQGETVPFSWFERAIELFRAHHLSPILFTAGGGPFELDDCYVLAESGGDLVIWEEAIPARHSVLVEALREGEIYSLGLDSPRAGCLDRSDWRADVSVHTTSGELYVGIDEELVSDPVALLRQIYDNAKSSFDIRYGVAYKMPLAEAPASYASGFSKTSVSDVFEFIRHRREWDSRQKTPDELWSQELYERRRHLTGLFRGAYPASILSDAHLQAANLRSQTVGKLSELDPPLWLWELSESEIPKAEAMLRAENALVSQMTQQ
jgi:hypothetical protein